VANSKYTKFTLKRREDFLTSLANGNTVTTAARSAGMTREAVYKTRRSDPDFEAAWDEANQQGADVIEQEAIRRAVAGVDKPVYQGGARVGVIREYSDSLLALVLKVKKKEYRESVAVEHKGKVRHEHAGRIDLRQATDDELAMLERLAVRANGHAG
jgi:hypothetical protein